MNCPRVLTAGARTALALLCFSASAALADERLEARRHFRLGMSLIAQGQHEEGIEELEEAYNIKPHPNVLYNIARAYSEWGQTQEAVQWYQRYLNTDPQDSERVAATLAKLQAELAASAPAVTPAPPPPAAPAAAAPEMVDLLARLEKAVDRAEKLEAAREARARPSAPSAGEAGGGRSEAKLGDSDEGSVPYEERVVTASRRAQSSLEAPNATSVITAEEIRLSGATTLFDLLRRVPGAEVMAMGVGSANVSLRGFNQRIANKMLVLLDGRTEYQDFLGVTLWSGLPVGLEEIDRIEVIRGPGSALYGANAMLGVVNIITRAPGSGPRSQFRFLGGSGRTGSAAFVGHGAAGGLRYRASGGYAQTDKWSRDFSGDRADVQLLAPERDVGLQSARANLVGTYRFSPAVELGASAGVNRLSTELYPLGLLRNYFLDGLTSYVMSNASLGPVRLKGFWNHLDTDAGPQYGATGQRSLATRVRSNVFNAEALYSQGFELLGTHQLNVGGETRLKRLAWDYLGEARQQFHLAAFVQDEWQLAEPFRVFASYRVDRHPLLDRGRPGLAHSPRVSTVFLPGEGHAFRASAAAAFREPTMLESYTALRIPLPGVNGASALTTGNVALKPERLVAFELGYRGESAELGVEWDLALYQNRVSSLIALSALQPTSADEAYDPVSNSYLLGRSFFQNEPGVYTARGVEAGLTLAPLDGLGIKASTALQRVSVSGVDEAVGTCGPCSQAPAFKLFAGVTYRTREDLELGLEGTFTSGTRWIEREPSASDPTRIDFVANALPSYVVLNARLGYSLVKDRVDLAVVGTNLAPAHQEHPFGNRIERRVLALFTVTP